MGNVFLLISHRMTLFFPFKLGFRFETMSQDGKEDGKIQSGFISTVLSVLSGSRRARSPASPANSDLRQGPNIVQPDVRGSQGIPSDGVLSSETRDEDATPPPEGTSKGRKNFRYDEGPQTLANESSSSGFRYFKNDEIGPSSLSSVVKKAGNTGDDSREKGLISGLLSPVRDSSHIGGGYLPDPPFPLSRPFLRIPS